MDTFGTFICEIFGDMICFPYFPEKSNWTMEGVVLTITTNHPALYTSWKLLC